MWNKSKWVINMKSEEKVIAFLQKHHGYITTKEFLNLGISKPLIQKFIDSNLVERVSHGIYMDAKLIKDEYYILQKKYPSAILSYNTALYILNLTNRTPIKIDITIPRNKRVRGDYNVHRVSDKYYNIGIINTKTPLGNPVKIYNAERSICDMLRTEEFDLELQNRILDYYFHSNDKDIDLLLDYALKFKIYDKVNAIIEWMMKW